MKNPPTPHRLLAAILFAAALGSTVACGGEPRRSPPAGRSPHEVDTAILLRELDLRAQVAASARPGFAFPARIGLARVENGAITAIPADEWAHWRSLRDRLPPRIGEITPVTSLVAQSLTTAPVSRTPHDSITNLRLAAAREQLDAILLYEVATTQSLENTELTLLDATIVGAWWFPTHRSHLASQASATLIDVRSGLAYGSVIGHATDVCSATMLGSEEKLARQRAATVRKSVATLTGEVDALFTRLAQSPRSAPIRSAAPAAVPIGPERASPRPTADEDRIIPPPTDNGGDAFWGQ